MKIHLQPKNLSNDIVKLVPLSELDFDKLFEVAQDPLIWVQHPNPYRYKKEDFKKYFEGAIDSKGAFIIFDSKTNQVVGCSRFYDFNAETKSIKIGYTFISRKFWGLGYNKNIKKLMINYVFENLENVIFEVGAKNFRSQKAIEKIGATRIGQREVKYFGEDSKLNFIYQISKI
ncbi:MAG: GNAT family N-acetyltransferase [Flavobacterium sp.]|nr:GNAT family N-acetyltransferase [Flavobacterium sp.]